MTIFVERFEASIFKKDTTIRASENKSVKIKDHSTDEIICVVNFAKTSKGNIDIATKIIETLENYIEDAENETENQH